MDYDPAQDYNRAVAFATGTGVDQDPSEAARLMRAAADSGYVPAVRDLGVMYVNGDGVERDPVKGFELLSKAVAEMDPRAMYHLALLYWNGFGTEKDLHEALRLMGFAAGMKITGAEEDAERIEAEIDALRVKNLNSRPILHLEISENDVEACCCRKMYDAVLAREIYQVESYKGPVLMTEDEEGERMLSECPFCGHKVMIVPKDKRYRCRNRLIRCHI